MRTIEREQEPPPEMADTAESDESTLSMDTDFELPVVLIVDDEPQIIKAVRRLLVDVDCEVCTATSGTDALSILDDRKIAVLISDQRMPGLSGVALLNYARKNHPDTVRIMLTGSGDWETAMEAINQGEVFRFVAKPWDHERFARTVEDGLAQHELIRSKKRYEKFIRTQNERLRTLNDELEERVDARTRELTERNEDINRLNEELESSFSSTIKAMLTIMEIGDIHIAGHCRNTADRVRAFGRFLGLANEQVRHLERAALLHWIGLINAPPTMFRKPVADYDAEEMATWEFHPTLGQQAVAQVPTLDRAGQIIVHYLRRYDQPALVSSEELSATPLAESCQVLNICSTFERTQRLEREEVGVEPSTARERGLVRLRAGAGSEFDPSLVDSFSALLSEQASSREADYEIELEQLEDGMVLSRPIETDQGVPVAPREVVVTPRLLERLERFHRSKGLGAIYVRAH